MNKFTIAIFFVALSAGVAVWLLTQKKTTEDFELDKAKQELIWDLEHITFEIETYFGKPFAKALISGDDDDIRNLLHSEFKAQLIELADSEDKQIGTFSRQSWNATGSPKESDAEGLISFFRDPLQAIQQGRTSQDSGTAYSCCSWRILYVGHRTANHRSRIVGNWSTAQSQFKSQCQISLLD